MVRVFRFFEELFERDLEKINFIFYCVLYIIILKFNKYKYISVF